VKYYWRFFAINLVFNLLFAAIVNVAEPVYYQPLDYCEERSTLQHVFIVFLICLFIIPYIYLLVKLRKASDGFGVKFQIKGTSLSWVVGLVFIVIFLIASSANHIVDLIWQFIAIVVMIVPFLFDTIYPLYMNYKVKKALSLKSRELDALTLENILCYQTKDGQEPGYKSVIQFLINEQQQGVDFEETENMMNAVLFLQEYWNLRQKDIKEEEEADGEDAKELIKKHDEKFMGRATLLWQKYFLHEKVDWHPASTSHFPVTCCSPELVQQLAEAIKDVNESPETANASQPAGVLRLIYDDLIERAGNDLFERFTKTPLFTELLDQLVSLEQLTAGLQNVEIAVKVL